MFSNPEFLVRQKIAPAFFVQGKWHGVFDRLLPRGKIVTRETPRFMRKTLVVAETKTGGRQKHRQARIDAPRKNNLAALAPGRKQPRFFWTGIRLPFFRSRFFGSRFFGSRFLLFYVPEKRHPVPGLGFTSDDFFSRKQSVKNAPSFVWHEPKRGAGVFPLVILAPFFLG